MARQTPDTQKRKAWFNLDDWSAEFATAAIDRFDAVQKRLEKSKKHARIQRMWRAVYMREAKGGSCDMTEIGLAGRRGEVLLTTSNRMGRLCRDHLTLVQQTKALPQPQAANSDPDCQDQVSLAKGICEHYKREKDLEAIKSEHAWVAELCGDAYLHIPWDADLGNAVAVEDVAREPGEKLEDGAEIDEDGEQVQQPEDDDESAAKQRLVYEGDYRFNVRTLYDVAYDRSSPERKEPRWWVVKEPINRFDLLQQVREEVADKGTLAKLEHAILNAPRWTDQLKKLDYDDADDEYDDSIPVYYVYVGKCRARASGRFAKIIDKKTVLLDSPMVEPRCPVFRVSQGEVLFRNESTTPNHDGLPLQDAIAAQLSTILSNNANYGLTRVVAPKEGNVEQTALDSGAAVVEYVQFDKQGREIRPPEPWSALDNNPQLYQFYELLCSELDLSLGGSPVTRGDPNATQGDSGSKVAALFAAAQNIGSSFVGSVLRCWEEVFTFLIDSLKIRATTDRVITIVGESNSYAAKKYSGEKLQKIIRVTVEQADVMRDTVQGRMAMVELLDKKTPEQQKQIIAIMQTGRVEPLTDPMEKPRLLLARENEALRNPEAPMPTALASDPHVEHWISHMHELCDPDVRANQGLRRRVEQHAQEHVDKLTPGHPNYAGDAALHITGQAPLPPEMPMPGPPGAQPGPMAGPQGPVKPGGPPGGGDDTHPIGAAVKRSTPQQPNMPTNPISGKQMTTGGTVPGKPQQSPVMG